MTNLSDVGITVKGEEINQSLSTCFVDTLETDSTIIILKLIGYDGELKTSRDKLQCKVCGKINKSKNKFCWGCGSYLE
jgi:rRNA maturation endonuclease Nob1